MQHAHSYQTEASANAASGRDDRSRMDNSQSKRSSFVCAVFTQLVLLTSVLLVCIYCLHFSFAARPLKAGGWKFDWHPVLMVSAFVFFMGEAIISYRILPFSFPTKKLIHLSLQTMALSVATVGLWAMITYHIDNKIPDFYSAHGLLGIITYSLFVVQYIIGFISFFQPRLNDEARAKVIPWHRYIGIVLFLMTWVAMLSGLMDRQRITNDEPFSPAYSTGNAMGCMIVLSGATILFHFSPVAQHAGVSHAKPAHEVQQLLP